MSHIHQPSVLAPLLLVPLLGIFNLTCSFEHSTGQRAVQYEHVHNKVTGLGSVGCRVEQEVCLPHRTLWYKISLKIAVPIALQKVYWWKPRHFNWYGRALNCSSFIFFTLWLAESLLLVWCLMCCCFCVDYLFCFTFAFGHSGARWFLWCIDLVIKVIHMFRNEPSGPA